MTSHNQFFYKLEKLFSVARSIQNCFKINDFSPEAAPIRDTIFPLLMEFV